MTLLQCNITHILNKFASNQISVYINHVSLRNQARVYNAAFGFIYLLHGANVQIGLKEFFCLKRHIVSMQNKHKFKMQYQYTKIQRILHNI